MAGNKKDPLPKMMGVETAEQKPSLVKGELEDLEAMRLEEGNKRTTNGCLVSWEDIRFNLRIIRQNPRILFFTLFIFAVVCGGCISLIMYLAEEQNSNSAGEGLDLAIETGRWFSDQLNQAILPLFSLAQFVREIEGFTNLTQIALAPPLPEPDGSYRNTSGVCDNPATIERFDDIAKNIKENSGMDGILLSLQLVPNQVVCMIYPLINTEDFPDGTRMDNRAAIGLDLLAIPSRISYSESVLSSGEENSDATFIAGPLELEECSGDNGACVKQAFIAARPVDSSTHEIAIGDSIFNRWGSVEAIINWKALIDRSDIFDKFNRIGKGFRLSRNDITTNPETGEESSTQVILAETDDFEADYYSRVSTELDTVDDLWKIEISYREASKDWLPAALVVTVILLLFFAALVLLIMLQKQKLTVISRAYMEDLAQPQKLRLRMFLDVHKSQEISAEVEEQILTKKPIADFFPQCTVFIADIVGFPSWSSEREPSQVFKLLQTVFYHFDEVCRRRKVLKVETSAATYIAVAGIPEPQEDHVVRMTKFAQECRTIFNILTRELEKQLGPQTADLKLRIGLSSGPVMGGILLGGDQKFHVFGSTVNTANSMEQLSEPDRIHLCEKATNDLVKAGRKKWVHARKEKVHVRGMGDMQTYFITQRKKKSSVTTETVVVRKKEESYDTVSYCSDLSDCNREIWDGEDDQSIGGASIDSVHEVNQRLIDWQVESLQRLLKKIVAFRKQRKKKPETFSLTLEKGEMVLDEVTEVIQMPLFDGKTSAISSPSAIDSIRLGSNVETQLRAFVEQIASLYHDNPFHNFEHANHVTMAVHKLLNRIVTPEDVNYNRKDSKKIAAELHDYTFGITSDPLTHFAVVLSALVHDCDHLGVSNAQLGMEKPGMAKKYRSKSIAEQNSIDLAWELLMQPDHYIDLQKCIFADKAEYVRFRQLMVNTVLATDIFDCELKALRNMRWDRAFHSDELQPDSSFSSKESDLVSLYPSIESESGGESERSEDKALPKLRRSKSLGKIGDFKRKQKRTSTNRKATIVIEHIIQASDVAHTMQHWNVYKRWNEKLFEEMYLAYKNGRSNKDPSQGWYKGELWFFDNYVIPLAKKLDECGVFGVASDECLFNAIENRREWASRGEDVVVDMIRKCQHMNFRLDSVLEEGGEAGDFA